MIALLAASALAAAPVNLHDPHKTGLKSPNDAGVVIGIQDYAELPEATYADTDAVAFSKTLKFTRGIPDKNTWLIKGEVKKQAILDAVTEAAGLVKEGGVLWVFYAGHGATVDAAPVLLPSDAGGKEPGSDVITLAELQQVAGRTKGTAVLILDTSFGGAARGGGKLYKPVLPTLPEPTDGVVTWTASRPTEITSAWEEPGQGLFTYFVIGAMRGWADNDADGSVTLAEAQDYVRTGISNLGFTHQNSSRDDREGVGSLLISTGTLEGKPPLGPLTVPDKKWRDKSQSVPAILESQASAADEGKGPGVSSALGEQRKDLKKSARKDWNATHKTAMKGGKDGKKALETFIADYEARREITDQGKVRAVPLPQLDEARAWLANYDDKKGFRPHPRAHHIGIIGASLGVAGIALMSSAAAMKSDYNSAAAPQGQLSDVVSTNRSLGATGYAVGGVALGLGTAAVLTWQL